MKVRRNLLIALSLLSLGANAQRIKGSDTVLPVAQQTAEQLLEVANEMFAEEYLSTLIYK